MAEMVQAVAVRDHLGEGPIWNAKEQTLYWVDITTGTIHTWQPATNKRQDFVLGFSIGCLGLCAKGGLVLATKRGLGFWDAQNGFRVIANPNDVRPTMRFNDGKVDRQGRFWAGTMRDTNQKPEPGFLYRLDADLSLHTMESNLAVPNGTGWSLDNKTMYFTDSPTHCIFAYDFDAATGNMANRRVFAKVADDAGTPDGLTVDSEGFVWSAHWGGWRITRYDPSGKVERVVKAPVERPTSLAFGGRNLDELYITSAAQDITEEQRKSQPLAGDVLVLKPGVKGLEEPAFVG